MLTVRGTTAFTLTETLPSFRGEDVRVLLFFANLSQISWLRNQAKKILVSKEGTEGKEDMAKGDRVVMVKEAREDMDSQHLVDTAREAKEGMEGKEDIKEVPVEGEARADILNPGAGIQIHQIIIMGDD